MKIGQVAEQAGVSIDTVRFYERRGVLPTPERTPSGYRIYEASTVERIRFARALQHLGFTLDEAIDALRSHDTGAATCESELWRMQAVIDRIDTKIAELQATRRDVSETMDACQQGHCRFGSRRCPHPQPSDTDHARLVQIAEEPAPAALAPCNTGSPS